MLLGLPLLTVVVIGGIVLVAIIALLIWGFRFREVVV